MIGPKEVIMYINKFELCHFVIFLKAERNNKAKQKNRNFNVKKLEKEIGMIHVKGVCVCVCVCVASH